MTQEPEKPINLLWKTPLRRRPTLGVAVGFLPPLLPRMLSSGLSTFWDFGLTF